MKKTFLTISALMLVGHMTAHGQSPQGQVPAAIEEQLSALKELKIDAAASFSVERDDSPTALLGKNTANNLPPRTIVKILLQPAKGSNINVEIWLPDADKWNHRLLGLGNAGAAGHIGEGGFVGGLVKGYATATTDMGTSPNADSGIGNPEVWKDFGFRATHLMTVVAKQVVQAYYGKAADYSYFYGTSTGGQQSLEEAQRYPEDYDGIVAGLPAHCRTPLHAYFLWCYQILAKCPFTPAQQANVIAAGTEYMASREIPAIAGKFVSDPRATSKDIDAVIALARTKDPTITDDQAEALHKLFDGPRSTDTGERIFDGMPIGSTFNDSDSTLYLFKWVFGAKKDLHMINFGSDIDTYTAALGPYLNAENPDLGPFLKHGGKLIMFSGSADSTVPYHATLDYYERVVDKLGSLDTVQSFFRYYIIPGMAHGGGPGINQQPDFLPILKTWRETGVPPDALPVRRFNNDKKVIEFTMTIYPYPQKTGWDAATSGFKPVDGPRGGVERISDRFLPPAGE